MPSKQQRDSAGTRASAEEGREWLTLGQAAAFLGAAQSTVRKWADGGRLRTFYTPGGHRRFRRTDLEAFLAGARALPAPAAAAAGASVLVVDDDARLREFVRVHLEREGCRVREAGSAEEGLAALDEQAPDLVLLDVSMPEVDGWTMLRRVQERHGVETIPVIMYSGEVDASVQAVERGARAFIGKPFDPRRLLEATRQILGS
ncbi:MAG TPA: response regulator [Gaiellaceae bacterium]|nr:response regulator [Gaiellaceae bacterium]